MHTCTHLSSLPISVQKYCKKWTCGACVPPHSIHVLVACMQEYLQFILGPKPGSEAFAALFPGAMEGQEEASRMAVVRCV